eukprot:6212919-Pleurochrysis_carterae.AAC.1
MQAGTHAGTNVRKRERPKSRMHKLARARGDTRLRPSARRASLHAREHARGNLQVRIRAHTSARVLAEILGERKEKFLNARQLFCTFTSHPVTRRSNLSNQMLGFSIASKRKRGMLQKLV